MNKNFKYIGLSAFLVCFVGFLFFSIYQTFVSSSSLRESNRQVALEASSQVQESTAVSETESQETSQVLDQAYLFEGLDLKEASQDFMPKDNQLTLRSVGDVLLHDRVSMMADPQSEVYQRTKAAMMDRGFEADVFQEDQAYDFMPMIGDIQPYLEYADVTVANMEIIVASPQLPISGYPNFSAPKEILTGLKTIGVDILSNATNHTLDFSSEGVQYSLANIDEAGLQYYGSYKSWEDKQVPRIIEKNGIKVGFLAYSYGTNGIPVPPGQEYLVNLIDLPAMVADVEALKEQVDAVVVSLQLGGEYDTQPNDDQFYVYQALADAGVKLILGGHPHCLQAYDWYNDQETFAIYSQASFLTGQEDLSNKLGGITEVTFVKDDQGQVKVKNPKFMPTFNLGISEEKMYQVVPLADYNLYQIPEGQALWQTIEERMSSLTQEGQVVHHLETKSSLQDQSHFR